MFRISLGFGSWKHIIESKHGNVTRHRPCLRKSPPMREIACRTAKAPSIARLSTTAQEDERSPDASVNAIRPEGGWQPEADLALWLSGIYLGAIATGS